MKTEIAGDTSACLVIKNTKQSECNKMSSVGNELRFEMTAQYYRGLSEIFLKSFQVTTHNFHQALPATQ